MVTPKIILYAHTLFLMIYKNRNITLKTEQAAIVYAQCDFIDSCIKPFLNKLYTPKAIVQNVPKRDVFVKFCSSEVRSFENYLMIN